MVVTPVDDHVELNFTRQELVVLAREHLNRWEYQRFKLCMMFITDPTICRWGCGRAGCSCSHLTGAGCVGGLARIGVATQV